MDDVDKLRAELEQIPEKRQALEDQIAALEAERGPLQYAAHSEGDKVAGTRLAELNAELLDLHNQAQGLAWREENLQAQIAEAERKQREAELQAARKKDAQLASQIDEHVKTLEAGLLDAARLLQECQDLSNRRFDIAKAFDGEMDPDVVKYGSNNGVRSLEPKLTLVYGRIGRLRLDVIITDSAKEWYQENT